MGIRHYRSVVDGVTDPICDLCRESPQTLKHWLQSCPATAQQCWALFGEDSGRLDCLTRHPGESLALAKTALDLGARREHPSDLNTHTHNNNKERNISLFTRQNR